MAVPSLLVLGVAEVYNIIIASNQTVHKCILVFSVQFTGTNNTEECNWLSGRTWYLL
jgi:hypothetical protein